jgi:Flp pilus assembly protein TadD
LTGRLLAAAAADGRFDPACRRAITDAYLRRGRDQVRQAVADPASQDALARSLANDADESARDAELAVELALKATRAEPKVGRSWNTLGAAHYRAGDLKAARAALERSRELGDGGNAADGRLLALIHHRRDDGEAARK